MKRLYGLLIIIPIILLPGCNIDKLFGGEYYSSDDCIIENLERYDATPGQFARFVITVTNISGSTLFNISCSVKLKIGDTIIDRGNVSFGSLDPGESAINEVWFSEISKHTDYEYYEITLYWQDDEGNYYENEGG